MRECEGKEEKVVIARLTGSLSKEFLQELGEVVAETDICFVKVIITEERSRAMNETKNVLQKLNSREYEKLSFYRSVVQDSKEGSTSKPSNITESGASKVIKSESKK